jgi:cytoskeletal protein CcmA (bactofilin family)
MAQTIKLKRSAEAGNVPETGQLALGEIAINTKDGLVFIKRNDGVQDSIVRVNDRDTDDLTEGSSNLYFTNQRARDAIDGNPLSDIDYIDLVTSQDPPSYVAGRLFYHNEYKALSVYNDEADITLQVGQEEWVRVYNNSGSTITDGTPVYANGAFGESPTILPADATTEAKAKVLGLATHSIENASYGYVTVRGLVSSLDTSGLTAGSPVHLASDGSLQNSAPTYPYFPTEIGICIVSDASNGYIYVHTQEQSFESFRVSGNSHLDGNLTVDGDLTVNGTQSVVSQNNLSIDNSFIYLNSGDSIGEANTTFSGSGLDDAYFRGHYEGTTTKTYYVRIDGVGTGTGGVDTFEWSYDNFSTTEATGVDITGSTQALGENITIFFNATTGHTSNDTWSGSASPLNTDSGWFSNRNTGTSGVGYTHMGLFFDVSSEKFRLVETYDPEPEGTIDTSDSSYVRGTLVGDFEGSLDLTGTITGAGSVDISGDITTSGEVTAAQVNFGSDTSLSWNDIDNTLDLSYDGVTLQVGQEQHFYAKASEAISNGDVVMFAGAQGDHLLIKKADTSAVGFQDAWVVGVATQDFALNDFGYVTTFGKVRGLDTSSFSEGDLLYLSTSTAGALTSTKPASPGHAILIAAVTKSHATEGTILVRPSLGQHLDDLHDVKVTSVADGDRLQYNSSTEVWENVSNDMSELNNDMWEVTSTVPTDGSGKPTGYVWYIV